MKLLFDQNLSFRLCTSLGNIFPESSHARLVGLEQADDRTLWRYAAANGYTLVSLDADFAEMAALLGPPPKVIWLRQATSPPPLPRARCATTPTRSTRSTSILRHAWKFIKPQPRAAITHNNCFEKRNGRDIGVLKERRPSDGYPRP